MEARQLRKSYNTSIKDLMGGVYEGKRLTSEKKEVLLVEGDAVAAS